MLFDENEMIQLCEEMGIELVDNTPANQKVLIESAQSLFSDNTAADNSQIKAVRTAKE